jgi:hypothetical protein
VQGGLDRLAGAGDVEVDELQRGREEQEPGGAHRHVREVAQPAAAGVPEEDARGERHRDEGEHAQPPLTCGAPAVYRRVASAARAIAARTMRVMAVSRS